MHCALSAPSIADARLEAALLNCLQELRGIVASAEKGRKGLPGLCLRVVEGQAAVSQDA